MPTLRDKIKEIILDCGKKSKKIEKVNMGSGDIFKEYDKLERIFKQLINSKDEIIGRIMDEIDKEQKILRPPLRWFAGEMETDLRKNDFKSGWLDDELEYYRGKALKHLMALENIDSMKFETLISKKYAIERCVKAANYMMMIAHNLIEELKDEMEKKVK